MPWVYEDPPFLSFIFILLKMLVSTYNVVTLVPEEDSSKRQSQEQRHRAQDKSSPFFFLQIL